MDKVINMNNDEFKKFKNTETYKKYKSGFNSVRNYHISNKDADSLWKTNNAEDAAKAFMYKLEKPKHDSGNERAEYAKKFLDLYNLVYPK